MNSTQEIEHLTQNGVASIVVIGGHFDDLIVSKFTSSVGRLNWERASPEKELLPPPERAAGTNVPGAMATGENVNPPTW